MPLLFLVKLQAFSLKSAILLKDGLLHWYFSRLWGCLCDNWKPSFLHLFIFNWHTFLRQVTAHWWPQWAKNQVLTNQNSRNRWCQIVRQTIWFWQLSKNTYLKEHLWMAASKETYVMKSLVKVYESLYKRCGVTPHFFSQGKNIYQKTIVRRFSAAEVERIWKSWKMNLSMPNCTVFIIYEKTSFSVDEKKSCYIPWLINFNNFQMKGKICFIGNWFDIIDSL